MAVYLFFTHIQFNMAPPTQEVTSTWHLFTTILRHTGLLKHGGDLYKDDPQGVYYIAS
jgi:hypothetical protein